MTAVIDASVLLAAILNEPGGDLLDSPGELFHLSIINLAEVYTKVVEFGGSVEDVSTFIRPMPIRVRAFREGHAGDVALLPPLTRHRGLGLGDRACLALGMATRLPVYTAEHKWIGLDLDVEVRLIRERER